MRLKGTDEVRATEVNIIFMKAQKILKVNLWEKQPTSGENISRTCQARLPPNSLVSFFYL